MRGRAVACCASVFLIGACGHVEPPSGESADAAVASTSDDAATAGADTRLAPIQLAKDAGRDAGPDTAAPLPTLSNVDPAVPCSSYSIHDRPTPLGGRGALGPLADGRVLLRLGIYDPWTGAVRDGNAQSHVAPAALLNDGTFLFVGGTDGGMVLRSALATVDRYDPVTDSMRATGGVKNGRTTAATVVLLDGRVLLLDGASGYWDKHDTPALAPPLVYDPALDTWRNTASVPVSRRDAAAARLGDGRVLIVGGFERPREGFKGYATFPATAVAEIYDPVADSFRVVPPMHVARMDHVAVSAPDGSVYVFGGADELRGERFDPKTETWSWTAAAPRRMDFTLLAPATHAWLPCGGVAFADVRADMPTPKSSVLVYEPNADRWLAVPWSGPTVVEIVPTPVGAAIFPLTSGDTDPEDFARVLRP